jgi:hypothetical protein
MTHPFDEVILPVFGDPRLFGDESVNECDLFMLLQRFSDKEKRGMMWSPEQYNDGKVERVKKLIATGKEKNISVDYLYQYLELFPKLKVLMEKRQSYIHKLIPKVED